MTRTGRPKDGKADIIRQGYAEGWPVSRIAAITRISENSIRVRAHRMGLKHPGTPRFSYQMSCMTEQQRADFETLKKYRYRRADALQIVEMGR